MTVKMQSNESEQERKREIGTTGKRRKIDELIEKNR